MRSITIILGLALLVGCNRVPESAPLPKRAIDPATVGVIHGVVRLQGVPPSPTKIPVASFKECANSRTEDEDVLIRDGKVQNAFVYIKEGLEGYALPPPGGEGVLDQKGCLYMPRVIGLRVGQTLVVRNTDAFLHNVHALPKFSRSFNVGMNQGAPEIRRTFESPEVMVPIRCDVHPWMRAYVGVLPHPYFAVTSADGAFEIKNVPPGRYTLEVWHEKLGTQRIVVDVGPGEERSANFLLTPEKKGPSLP